MTMRFECSSMRVFRVGSRGKGAGLGMVEAGLLFIVAGSKVRGITSGNRGPWCDFNPLASYRRGGNETGVDTRAEGEEEAV
jgi:hypothetical protein